MRRLLAPLVLATLAVFAGCSTETEEPTPSAPRDVVRSSTASQVGWSCKGSFGKTKPADAKYYATSFGCFTNSKGKLVKESGDNCIPGCQNIIGSELCPNSNKGPQCEAEIKWFAADAARYSCGARLKVTNPKNGKSLVVVAIDYGPSCSVEAKVKHAALDLSYPSTDYLFGGQQGVVDRSVVTVEEVGRDTPLGPFVPEPEPEPTPEPEPPPEPEPTPDDSDSLPSEPQPAPDAGGCGTVDYVGQCDGTTLSYCEDDQLVTAECLQSCGLDEAHGLFDCGFGP